MPPGPVVVVSTFEFIYYTYLAEVLIYAWNGKFDNYHFSSVPGFSKHEKEIEDALDRMYSRKYAPITE